MQKVLRNVWKVLEMGLLLNVEIITVSDMLFVPLKNILGDAATRSMVAEPSKTYNVPAGHKGSDLTDSICNISLQRMRDLTLRQDLQLAGEGGQVPLKDVFQVGISYLCIFLLPGKMLSSPKLRVLGGISSHLALMYCTSSKWLFPLPFGMQL